MLGLAAVVEDVCAALAIDPPIYRRRMDFFHSDSEFDTSRARRVLGWEPKVDLAGRDSADAGGLPEEWSYGLSAMGVGACSEPRFGPWPIAHSP